MSQVVSCLDIIHSTLENGKFVEEYSRIGSSFVHSKVSASTAEYLHAMLQETSDILHSNVFS